MKQKPWYEKGWWWIKLLIFAVSCWFIYIHIYNEVDELGAYFYQYQNILFNASPAVILLFGVLALLNWSIEALKWQWVIQKVEYISFWRSMRAFFNGVTVSFFTPNRSGEFAGRILYLSPENRVRGALLTFLSSSAQLLVTLQMGLLSLIYFLPDFVDFASWEIQVFRMVLFLLALGVTGAWLRLPVLVRWVDRLKIKSEWKEKMHIWERCNLADFFWVMVHVAAPVFGFYRTTSNLVLHNFTLCFFSIDDGADSDFFFVYHHHSEHCIG
ncbi:MAG: flippase-like domain-containing protein [Bacteroidetes bacterium]|nr:flippase-like domain-containing protein [Bacteroidota bacterium]